LYDLKGAHDYQDLLGIFRRTIAMETEAHNNKELLTSISGEKPPPKANPVTTKDCRYGAACTVKGCQFKHPPSSKNPSPKSPDKSGGKGAGGKQPAAGAKTPKKEPRAKTPPGDRKKTPCYKWNMNACPKTAEECSFAHRAVTPEEKAAFDKYKADAEIVKAKAKVSAKSKANPKS
jgi:hypothetical protein